jgi:hypothetical protein
MERRERERIMRRFDEDITLYADKKNPLKGKTPIEFDKNGYVICWKIFKGKYHAVYTYPHYTGEGETKDSDGTYDYSKQPIKRSFGMIKAIHRKSKRISVKESDYVNGKELHVHSGICVYITKEEAKEHGDAAGCHIVPVRCHKSQLIAVGYVGFSYSAAMFMEVFLKKSDFDKVAHCPDFGLPNWEGDKSGRRPWK